MLTAQPGPKHNDNQSRNGGSLKIYDRKKKCSRNAIISNFNMAYGIDAFSFLNRKCKILILAVFGTILVGKLRCIWYIRRILLPRFSFHVLHGSFFFYFPQ